MTDPTLADLGYIRRRTGAADERILDLWAEIDATSKHAVVIELLEEILGKRRKGADSTSVPGQVAISYGTSIKALQDGIKEERLLLAEDLAGNGDDIPDGTTIVTPYQLERAPSSWR